MANVSSAEKRNRQSIKRRLRNRGWKSEALSARKSLYQAIEEGDAARGEKLFREYCSVLDKAVKGGALAGNAADRRKSRAAARMAALTPQG